MATRYGHSQGVDTEEPTAGERQNLLPPTTTTTTKKMTMKTASSARDHLANERTYLAWIRTSLALLGASIALFKWQPDDLWIEGLLLGLVGLIALSTSTYRYFRVMSLLKSNKEDFEPNVVSVLVVVISAFIAIAASFFIQTTTKQ